MAPAWLRKVLEGSKRTDSRLQEHIIFYSRCGGEINQQAMALRRLLNQYHAYQRSITANPKDKIEIEREISKRLELIRTNLKNGLSVFNQFKQYIKIFLNKR